MTELLYSYNYSNPNYIQIPSNFYQQINGNNNNKIENEEYNFINQKPVKPSDEFICPKCKGESTIKRNKFNIRIICDRDCCGFQSNYSPKDFEQSQYRDIIFINCVLCKKSISEDDCFYSLNYNIDICQECKLYYLQNFDHLIIPYTDKNSYCLEHKQKFISYCHKCKKNCCLQCHIDDNEETHIKEGFELNIKKRKKELEKVKEIYEVFKEKVYNDFLYILNSLLPKESIKFFVKKLMNNIDISFNIYYDIISSYGKIRTRKHLMNQNQFNMDCFYNAFIKIIEEKDSIKSILYFIELCKEVTHTNSATLIYGVNENNLIDDNYIDMKIFGKEFAEQNKDKCRINFKKIKTKIKENFRFKKEDISGNKVPIQLEIQKNDIKDFEYFCEGANLIGSPDIDKILVKKIINNFNEVIQNYINVEENKDNPKTILEELKYPENIYYDYREKKNDKNSVIQRDNPINDSVNKTTESSLTEYINNEVDKIEKQNSNKQFTDDFNKDCEKEEEREYVSIKPNGSNSKFSFSNKRKENLNPENYIQVEVSSIVKDYKTSMEQNSNDEIEQLNEGIEIKNQSIILKLIDMNYTPYDFDKIEKIIADLRNHFCLKAIYNFFVDIWNNCRELFYNYKTEFLNLIKREFSNLDSWYNKGYDPGINILKNESKNETNAGNNSAIIIARKKEMVETINMNNSIKSVKEESPLFTIKELIANTAPRIININSVRCNYNSRELYKFIFLSIITNHNSGRILFTHNGIKFHLVLISCNYGNKIVYISFLTNCVLLFYLKRRKCLIKFNFPYGYLFANNKFIIKKYDNLIPFK